MSKPASDFRPRDLALLLLASGETAPRQRARDQQADAAGLALKRRMLERVVELDPPPEELNAALCRIIEQFGPPQGPTRAVARALLDEWMMAQTAPALADHLLAAAAAPRRREGERRGRQLPG